MKEAGQVRFSTVASPPPATAARSRLRTSQARTRQVGLQDQALWPVPMMMPSYASLMARLPTQLQHVLEPSFIRLKWIANVNTTESQASGL
jgi:hypothetical protein